MTDFGMNESAWEIADACVTRAAELRIDVSVRYVDEEETEHG